MFFSDTRNVLSTLYHYTVQLPTKTMSALSPVGGTLSRPGDDHDVHPEQRGGGDPPGQADPGLAPHPHRWPPSVRLGPARGPAPSRPAGRPTLQVTDTCRGAAAARPAGKVQGGGGARGGRPAEL